MSNKLYSELIQLGFRRSGNSSYRPYCPTCSACIPVRIKLSEFKPSRSQRRCLKRNALVTTHFHTATFNQEHYALYSRYLSARHQGAGMDNPTQEIYQNFLFCNWSKTQFIEMRDQGQLVAVAVTDYIDDGLSAFYTFFDPNYPAASLGTFGILMQIKLAQELKLPYLYLGYWVENCQKMHYKANFTGLEGYGEKQWQPLKT
jgi:arginine-tRNA-protein transferase